MKNFKKLCCLGLVILMTVSTFTACGSKSSDTSSSNESQQITIKFLHKWPQPQNMPYFEEVVKDFEATHPNIKVNMEAVADEPIKDKLRVLMGSNDQPDIFFSWSGEFAKKFVRSNNVLDLTDALNSDPEWKDSFMKAGLEPFTLDGRTYGIPFRINGKFFVYNKEIFQKYNLKEPKTWNDFLNICETLKKNGVIPLAFGEADTWEACHYLTGLNQKLVPQDVREKDYNPNSGEFTDPGYVKALQVLKDLNDKGYFNKGCNSLTHNMALETWAKGQQAMFYVELEEFKDVNEKMQGKPWGFFAMPDFENQPGNKNFLTGAPDGFMISAKTKHPKEAIEFLKFLTSKENADKLVKTLGWPSPVIGAVNSTNAKPFLVDGIKAVQEADGMALWLDTDVYIKISDVYLPEMQEMFNGTKTPEQIMKDVQKIAQEVKTEVQQ